MPVSNGLIKRVAAGKDPIASLFNEQQLLFLFSMANKKIDYAKAAAAGQPDGALSGRWKCTTTPAASLATLTGELGGSARTEPGIV